MAMTVLRDMNLLQLSSPAISDCKRAN